MSIIGFCNPLLDITISNHPKIPDLLQKYNLKENDIILADESGKHSELIEEMKTLGTVEYTAGGAGLNSLRCAQLLLNKGTCSIVGSIGNDEYGRILIEKSVEVGIKTELQMTSPKETGKCACLIHGPHRSLVAYLDAANDFKSEHLLTVKEKIGSADFLYVTGFFYSVSPKSVTKVIEYKSEKGKLIFNLSATFVPDMMTEADFHGILKHCHILIGNSDEFLHLTRKLKYSESKDIEEFCKIISKNYPDLIIIITRGSDPISIVTDSKGIETIPVPTIPKEFIVDTNGAGDAFIGGILGGLELKFSLKKSIELGCFMASCVIKQSGIHPPKPEEVEIFLQNNNRSS